MTTPAERKTEICKAIADSMAKATEVDWAKDSPAISAAQHDLDEAMADYIGGSTSKANVRTVYQRWRDLHKTGGMTT